MKLLAFEVELARSKKIQLEKRDGSDKRITFFVGSFEQHMDYTKSANRLGVDEQDIVKIIDELYRAESNTDKKIPVTLELGQTLSPKPKFCTRPELAETQSGSGHDDFTDAFNHAITKSGRVITWEGTEWTCCLDIDFPEPTDGINYTPAAEHLIQFAESLRPTPLYYWLSKSGGMHLIYEARDGFDADELASVAGFQFHRRYPNAGIEFLARTRTPPGEYSRCYPDSEIDCIRSLLLQNVTVDVDTYLENKGWTIGQRLPHTECPVNPHERAEGNNPVIIRDRFVMCFICERDGKHCGSRKPGVFPYSALIGGRINSQIALCVKNFIHYSHAKHVLTSQLYDEQLARRVYSTLLKLQHGDDPRIPNVFTAGEPNGIVRYTGYWCDASGNPLSLEKGSDILRELPYCQSLLRNGAITLDRVKAEWMTQTIDLSVNGYMPVVPIHGIMLTQFQPLPANKIYTVLQIPSLTPEEMQNRRPQYITSERRLPIDTAWKRIEKVYPGVQRKLIELLLVGRGCVEYRSGLPPMLFITGPTGSGKTGHLQLAAAIAGDTENVVHLNKDRDRFNNALLSAKRRGGFLFFDEFFKYAEQARLSDVEGMEILLSYTPESMVYLIHIGAVPLGELPLFIWADTEIPDDVLAHEQIGRRVFRYHLANELSWEKSMVDNELLMPKNIRTHGSTEMVEASNAILSDVMDNWFTGTVTDFAQVASSGNFPVKLIRDSEALEDKHRLISDLFVAVCNAPEITDPQDRKRFPKGSKVTKVGSGDKLYQTFELCQTNSEHLSTKCRAINETDLLKVLKLRTQARLEIRTHGSKLALRFVSMDGKHINGRLKP